MITKQLIQGNTIWEITGPGFYATVKNDADGLPYLTRCNYVNSAQFPVDQAELVLISDVTTLLTYTGYDITATPERECEMFIRMLYVIGIQLDDLGTVFDLQTPLEVAGMLAKTPAEGTNFYNSIEVFDFMAMTGAIEYPFNRLIPGEVRPVVSSVPQLDRTLMLNVIRKLGIWGYALNILSEYGMSITEFAMILAEWKQTQQDRADYVNSYAVGFLRTKGYKLLSSSEKTEMIG